MPAWASLASIDLDRFRFHPNHPAPPSFLLFVDFFDASETLLWLNASVPSPLGVVGVLASTVGSAEGVTGEAAPFDEDLGLDFFAEVFFDNGFDGFEKSGGSGMGGKLKGNSIACSRGRSRDWVARRGKSRDWVARPLGPGPGLGSYA